METEIHLRTSVFDVEYCSATFRQVDEQLILLPKSGRVLAKIGWDHRNRIGMNQATWLSSVRSTLQHYGHYDFLMAKFGAPGVQTDLSIDGSLVISEQQQDEYYFQRYTLTRDDLSGVDGAGFSGDAALLAVVLRDL